MEIFKKWRRSCREKGRAGRRQKLAIHLLRKQIMPHHKGNFQGLNGATCNCGIGPRLMNYIVAYVFEKHGFLHQHLSDFSKFMLAQLASGSQSALAKMFCKKPNWVFLLSAYYSLSVWIFLGLTLVQKWKNGCLSPIIIMMWGVELYAFISQWKQLFP